MSSQSQKTGLSPEEKKVLINGKEDEFRIEIDSKIGGENDKASEQAIIEAKFLRARLQSRMYQKKLLSMDKVETISFWREITPYAIAAIIFVTFSGLLGWAYRKDQVEISITYDVGTITGGILAGSAAVIAATAYARKTAEADRGNSRDG